MVSVIIPVYNVVPYLRDCIESVMKQTWRDLQIILVDDGSPDGCGAICDDYARRDNRIVSLHKENGGVSSARNYGLQYASGKYVTFCDSDDMYAPDWIETLLSACETTGSDVGIGNYIKLQQDGFLGDASAHDAGMENVKKTDEKTAYIFNKLLTPDHGWEVCLRLFSMEIIRRENLQFCESCGNFAEDLGFTLTYMLFANRVISVDAAGYQYRIRSGSMMNTSACNPRLDSIQAVYTYCHPVICRAFDPVTAETLYKNLQFYLLGNQTSSYLWASGMAPDTFRTFVMDVTPDWPVMKTQISELLKQKTLGSYIPRSRKAEFAAHLRFLLGMPWNLLRIQCKLIRMLRPVLDHKIR